MAKITSRTQLNDATEIVIDTTNKTVQLVATGNLVAKDGVTLQAVYSKLMDLWNTATYNDYDFPMYAKDVIAGEYSIGYNGTSYNGWNWKDSNTRNYIRDGGWSEYNSSGTLTAQWCCFYGLGTLASSGSQLYYQIGSSSGSATNFTYTDMPNAAIKVYDSTGPVDNRAYAKLYDRPAGYVYSSASLSDTRASSTGAYIVAFPLSDRVDTHITDNDATVAASSPYTGITATWLTGNNFDTTNTSPYVVDDVVQDGAGRWYICTGNGTADATDYANLGAMAGAGTATFSSYSGERLVNGSYYAYNIIVDGNSAPYEKIYTKVQYLLRQAGDIDSGAGTHLGKVTDVLMNFSGVTLTTTTGVYIDNTQGADADFLVYTDVGGVERSTPVVHNQSVTVSGATAGSRIQIYDLTSSTELYNGTPTFPYTWTDSNPYVADREIRLRVAYVNGTTAKSYISTTIGTATSTNYALSYLVAQEDDAVYIANAVDGSTVTGVTVNDTTDIFEIDKSGGELTLQDLYAYAMYYRFGSTGIAGDRLAIEATDTANYSITGKTVKNVTSPSVPLKITGGWVTDADTGNPIDLIDTSGGTIFLAPPHVVAYATGGSLTTSNIADAVWDELLSGHTTAGSAGKIVVDAEANTDVTQAKVDQL